MSSARFVYAIVVGKGKSIFDGGRGAFNDVCIYIYQGYHMGGEIIANLVNNKVFQAHLSWGLV